MLVAYLKKFDEGVARGEAALATVVLLSMIAAASVQAIFRNLSGLEVSFANDALGVLGWVDPFLQKGTLWLAFLGASLATREERHIGIDLLPRLAPRALKLIMRALASFGSAAVSFYLARAFWAAVLVNAEERPADMEVWHGMEIVHICQGSPQEIADSGNELPTIFCGVRHALAMIDVPVSTPWAALQLIVPVMFVFIAVRLFFNGAGAVQRLITGAPAEEERPSGASSSEPEASSAAASAPPDDPSDEPTGGDTSPSTREEEE